MLLVRLQHIVEALEVGTWPVPANTVLLELAAENGTETPVEPGTPGKFSFPKAILSSGKF